MRPADRKKNWRRKNRDYRNACRRKYYAQSAGQDWRKMARWEDGDVRRIMDPHRPVDRLLAHALRRSISAIQLKRCAEKKRIQSESKR